MIATVLFLTFAAAQPSTIRVYLAPPPETVGGFVDADSKLLGKIRDELSGELKRKKKTLTLTETPDAEVTVSVTSATLADGPQQTQRMGRTSQTSRSRNTAPSPSSPSGTTRRTSPHKSSIRIKSDARSPTRSRSGSRTTRNGSENEMASYFESGHGYGQQISRPRGELQSATG